MSEIIDSSSLFAKSCTAQRAQLRRFMSSVQDQNREIQMIQVLYDSSVRNTVLIRVKIAFACARVNGCLEL